MAVQVPAEVSWRSSGYPGATCRAACAAKQAGPAAPSPTRTSSRNMYREESWRAVPTYCTMLGCRKRLSSCTCGYGGGRRAALRRHAAPHSGQPCRRAGHAPPCCCPGRAAPGRLRAGRPAGQRADSWPRTVRHQLLAAHLALQLLGGLPQLAALAAHRHLLDGQQLACARRSRRGPSAGNTAGAAGSAPASAQRRPAHSGGQRTAAASAQRAHPCPG
jgi:hypothetical protein